MSVGAGRVWTGRWVDGEKAGRLRQEAGRMGGRVAAETGSREDFGRRVRR